MVGLPTERGSWFLEERKDVSREVTPEEFSGLSRSIAIRNFSPGYCSLINQTGSQRLYPHRDSSRV